MPDINWICSAAKTINAAATIRRVANRPGQNMINSVGRPAAAKPTANAAVQRPYCGANPSPAAKSSQRTTSMTLSVRQ
jgi:hypothetical protein